MKSIIFFAIICTVTNSQSCTTPSSITGYDNAGATETALTISGFTVTGYICASGYSGTAAASVCTGGAGSAYVLSGCDICNFSDKTSGDYTVPATGCKLSQMITVTGIMKVSGVQGESPLRELAAMGGTPDASNPKRHFLAKNGAYLT